MKILLDKQNVIGVNTEVENVIVNDEKVLRVIKKEKIEQPDENTYAKIHFPFYNGMIEVKMLSRLLKNAPTYARGFIGIAYRINDDDTGFESFYVRPTNGRNCHDSIRKEHGCQYFSYPNYTFQYFRDHHMTQYEAPVDIDLNEWIDLKAIICNKKAVFFVNDQRVLEVDPMLQNVGQKGSIGLFVDIGTEAFFKDLVVNEMTFEQVEASIFD